MTRHDYAIYLLEAAARYVADESRPFPGKIKVSVRTRNWVCTQIFAHTCRPPALPERRVNEPAFKNFSREERTVLQAIKDRPLKGSSLTERSGIERSRLLGILAQLQDRGVVGNDEDGYKLLVELDGET